MQKKSNLVPLLLLVLLQMCSVVASGQSTPPEPLRLNSTLGVPDWASLKFEHRLRAETVRTQFRSNRPGDDSALSLRTLLSLEAMPTVIGGGFEFADSRVYLTDSNTALNNGLSNPIDVLQLYARARHDGAGDEHGIDVRVGRLTIDFGSRNLLARNAFRNTINSFTGVDATWRVGANHTIRAIGVVPVLRRPGRPSGIEANRWRLDDELWGDRVWAFSWQARGFPMGTWFDAYVIGLHEGDGDGVESRNRQLMTPGLRLVRPGGPGEWEADLELMGQFGSARQTANPEDREDLTHRAWSARAVAGYTLEDSLQTRISVIYDFASGDSDPGDDTLGRFDPLFGLPPVAFNPTGLYAALVRSNVNAPGAQVNLTISGGPTIQGRYRAIWLASARDAWPQAGLRDESGALGEFLGHQGDLRLRWTFAREVLHVDTGALMLRRAGVAREAPGAESLPMTGYLYSDLYVRF